MKRLGILLLSLLFVLSGCNQQVNNEPNQPVENNYVENDQSYEEDEAYDDEGYEFMPYTLAEFVSFQEKYLSEDQVKKANDFIDKINELEENYQEGDEDKIDQVITDLYDYLRSCGLVVANRSMEDFLNQHADQFSSEVQVKILDLYTEINDLNDIDPESDKITTLTDELSELLEEAGFNADDVIDQIQTGSVVFSKFNLKDGKLEAVNGKQYKAEDEKKFIDLAKRVVDILPNVIEDRVESLEINTDGKDNILAFVVQSDDTLVKWRMVLDISDAYDEEGNFIKEFDETIVHEGGHVLTLNASQMQETSTNTYETDEGILKEDSYLNQFYQKFWSDIQDSYDEAVDPNNEDSSYAYYDEHPDMFVSDYAATNPEEDIAETFRVFVFSEKPEGKELKDEKVRWFYNYDELVKIRTSIRETLNLN